MARSALRSDLYAVLADITSDVLATTSAPAEPTQLADRWEAQNSEGLAQMRTTLAAIEATGTGLGRVVRGATSHPHAGSFLMATRASAPLSPHLPLR
jgi:hypothetical protein